jgi:hypothetical protein
MDYLKALFTFDVCGCSLATVDPATVALCLAFTVGAVVTAGTGLVLRLISPNTPPRTTAYVDPRGAIGIVHHF